MAFVYKTEVFELPCGYLDEETHLLYSHVEVREMTGKDEDALSDRKKLRSGASINQLIANCCELILMPDEKRTSEIRLKVTPELATKLTQGDRLFILLKIRQVSHGDDYKFEVSCPHCEKRNVPEILLSQIPVKKMATPAVRHYDIEVPSPSGQGMDIVTFKISTGEEELKMQKLLEQNPDKLSSVNLAARLVTVNGQTTRPIHYLQELPSRVLDKFRAKVLEVEGGVDTRLKGVYCVSCQGEMVIDLPLQESFFLPQSSR